MKTTKIVLILLSIIVIASCSIAKRASSPTNISKSKDGIYLPGDEEVNALLKHYKNVTIEQLREGYSLYTSGACINCHSPKNIYSIPDDQWKDIIDNMAWQAHITDTQKDAVYKYVLAIKMTQSK